MTMQGRSLADESFLVGASEISVLRTTSSVYAGVLVVVRDLARGACRKLSSGKMSRLKNSFVADVGVCAFRPKRSVSPGDVSASTPDSDTTGSNPQQRLWWCDPAWCQA